jgi:ethanolamine utilization protein EutK
VNTINALGFIEVHGLVAGVEAADAMLKSAQVRLLRQYEVRPGLITVAVEGDLAACRAAVAAGLAAASRVGDVIAGNVIGRPDTDTETMVMALIPRPADGKSPPTGRTPGRRARAQKT